MTRYAVMWSGGKDSALAAQRARERGLEIAALVNFYDAASGRVRFHATRTGLIRAQADAMGIPLRSRATTWEGFEPELLRVLSELRSDGIGGIIFGDIHLADVRAWYEDRVRAAGLEHVEPLWGESPDALIAEFVATGGRAVVTCVEQDRLDLVWLGRLIDADFVREIGAAGVDPCGENGEYHSFAFAGPLFRTPVAWRAGPRRDDGRFAQLDVLPG